MFETPITVIGRIVTDPTRRHVGDQDVVKFRLASNARRRTADGTWEPGNSLYLAVNCWGKLATGVAGSLAKGDAVICVGSVHTAEYDDKEGNRRSSLEMRATSVGPDLSRYLVELKRVEERPGPGPILDAADASDEREDEQEHDTAA
ncbi:single-stranded DNA-binding protein [Mycolicibacterium confluentis]|uniref:Single-stranded DNA-binding protein n=1 Tax=Mycolicibacterium confluentis TaxID=28047 RepID=A0A7I7XTY2_9MYCO|nr:single-stranded DNA-binding protein [Mycolicibacterium confluentis]MCV7320910.1 single-stranded DNA-binding protein [Mycolicibacterium confluentis]ORV27050.1 hypothetical protein AWB99_19975 [Mycolicibacterium confluentis]BBZ32687.1 single-stranded DNA-binding protein [Mycolicibacterium confluentis]